MNRTTKKWTILLSTAVLAAALTACTKQAAGGPSPSQTGSGAPSASASASNNPAADASPSGTSSPEASATPSPTAELPAKKDFTFEQEGTPQTRTGTLVNGPGYAMYVFDHFHFAPELSLLTLDIDKEYYARIEKLPAGYNLEDIKKEAGKDLAKVGKVRETSGNDISPLLGGAELMLIANGDKLTQEVIVKTVDGTGYRIYINMPHTEASEGFGPNAFVMLSSIANTDKA